MSSEQQTKELGRVERCSIEISDHGALSFEIAFSFGGSGQSLTAPLDTYDQVKQRRVGTAAGADLLLRVLGFFKARRLEDVVGRIVYAVHAGNAYGLIVGLELPPFDGGARLMIDEWRAEWRGGAG